MLSTNCATRFAASRRSSSTHVTPERGVTRALPATAPQQQQRLHAATATVHGPSKQSIYLAKCTPANMVNLWPFQKNFSEIPCAREASIAGMLGGVGLGASSILITNQTKYAFKTSTYGGFLVFWITFLGCRYQASRQEKLSKQFVDSLIRGDID